MAIARFLIWRFRRLQRRLGDISKLLTKASDDLRLYKTEFGIESSLNEIKKKAYFKTLSKADQKTFDRFASLFEEVRAGYTPQVQIFNGTESKTTSEGIGTRINTLLTLYDPERDYKQRNEKFPFFERVKLFFGFSIKPPKRYLEKRNVISEDITRANRGSSTLQKNVNTLKRLLPKFKKVMKKLLIENEFTNSSSSILPFTNCIASLAISISFLLFASTLINENISSRFK